MANKPKIFYNESEINAIMTGHAIESMEQEIMMRKKSEIEAAFFQKFGEPGAFKFSVVRTANHKWHGRSHSGRVIYRIIPDSARTYALLRKEPGWLDQFVD